MTYFDEFLDWTLGGGIQIALAKVYFFHIVINWAKYLCISRQIPQQTVMSWTRTKMRRIYAK